MMKQDPSITAVREVRHKISASVGHNPYKLIQHYKKLQERHKHRLVTQTSTFIDND